MGNGGGAGMQNPGVRLTPRKSERQTEAGKAHSVISLQVGRAKTIRSHSTEDFQEVAMVRLWEVTYLSLLFKG